MKIRQINSFENGMSPDEYKGGDGYFYYGENMDIRKRSKQIFPTQKKSTKTLMNNRVGGLLTGLSGNYFCTKDGRIQDGSGVELYKDSAGKGYYGITIIGSYYVIFTENGIHRAPITGILGSNLTTDPDLTDPLHPGWGTGLGVTGRSFATLGKAVHAPIDTDFLRNGVAASIGAKYQIKIKIVGRTAGSCTITFGGLTVGTVSADGEYIFYTAAASSTAFLDITPTLTFDGGVDYLYAAMTSVTEGYLTRTPSSSYHPILNLQSTFLYVGSGKTIQKIDLTTSPWIVTTALTLGSDDTVVGLTRIGESFIIYTSVGSYNGRQYFWDGFSTSPDREIYREGLPIINVANLGNIDYVFCSLQGTNFCYKVSGYEKQLLFKSNNATYDILNTKRFQTYPLYTGAIETVDNIIFMPDLSTSSTTGGHLYSIGSLLPGQQNAINNEHSIYQQTGTITTSMLYRDPGGVFLRWGYMEQVGSNYSNYYVGVRMAEWSLNYSENAYIETLKFHGDDFSKIKSLQKIRFGYYLPTSDRNIKVYTSVDGGAYSLKKTVTSTTLKYCIIEGDIVGVKFQELQIKFEINNTTATTSCAYISLPITIRYNDDDQA